MPQKKKVFGACRVCGEQGHLTYEHVPPKCAFNRFPAKMYGLDQWMILQSGGPARYENQRRGSGYVTLCRECNNERGGRWNVPEFCKWTDAAASVIARFPHGKAVESATLGLRKLRPLPFAKQIVSILLALNAPGFGEEHPQLRAFVLAQDRVGLGGQYHLYLSLFDLDFARWAGRYDAVNVLTPPFHTIATELSHFPFTYTLVVGESLDPEFALAHITEFTRYKRHESFEGKLVLPVNGSFLPFALLPEADERG